MNANYESNVLPSGLPMYIDEVLVENSPGSTRSISTLFDFQPSVYIPGNNSRLESSSLIDDSFKSSALIDDSFGQLCDEGNINDRIPLWSDDEIFPLSRTHYELNCCDNSAINIVWTFLKSFPRCVWDFNRHEFIWKCSYLDENFETIKFSINLLYNIQKDTILIEFRRSSGSSCTFQFIYRELQNHIINTDPSIIIISSKLPDNQEMKRRRMSRNMTLKNAPEVSQVELNESLAALYDWLGGDLDQSSSSSSATSATSTTNSSTGAYNLQSLQEAIRVGTLVTQTLLAHINSTSSTPIPNDATIDANTNSTTDSIPSSINTISSNITTTNNSSSSSSINSTASTTKTTLETNQEGAVQGYVVPTGVVRSVGVAGVEVGEGGREGDCEGLHASLQAVLQRTLACIQQVSNADDPPLLASLSPHPHLLHTLSSNTLTTAHTHANTHYLHTTTFPHTYTPIVYV